MSSLPDDESQRQANRAKKHRNMTGFGNDADFMQGHACVGNIVKNHVMIQARYVGIPERNPRLAVGDAINNNREVIGPADEVHDHRNIIDGINQDSGDQSFVRARCPVVIDEVSAIESELCGNIISTES